LTAAVDVIIHPLLNVVDDKLGGRVESGGGDDDDERSGRKFSWQDVEASIPAPPIALTSQLVERTYVCREPLPNETLPSNQITVPPPAAEVRSHLEGRGYAVWPVEGFAHPHAEPSHGGAAGVWGGRR
jgi:hypothetical protein